MTRTRRSFSLDDSRIILVLTNGDRAKYGNAHNISDSGYSQSAGPSNMKKIFQKPGTPENYSRSGTTTPNLTESGKIASVEVKHTGKHDGAREKKC